MARNRDQKNLTDPAVSIVVPTYREAENIPELLERIRGALASFESGFEIVVVDDYSGDGTDGAVGGMQEKEFPVRLITRRDGRDLSSAVLRGFYESSGDILVCMDADLSHPPETDARFQCNAGELVMQS